ncbi:MAG: spore maturation protein [Ruminococcaceae bacterium]|nr:spore maturation protein [Oscillospiraceae bacterium]
MLKALSSSILPLVVCFIILFGLCKKINIFEAFIAGAAEGIHALFSILPALVALIFSITMLRTSGALDFLISLLTPITKLLHIPPALMPLAILRPVSGSGSLAVLGDLLNRSGPDSLLGRMASVIMGSTETTFYALAVYFGSVKIKNSRHTVPAALVADLVGLVAGVYICLFYF